MRFQKAIKRMVALGTGAIMVGSSVFAAADLANFPSPFIKDGKFNGIIVVGDTANAQDVIGMSDIMASLQFAATKKAPVGGSVNDPAPEGGDSWKVGYGNTKVLEMSENLATGTNRESIATITSSNFIDDSEMPELLAHQTVNNPKGDAEYDQRLYFEDTGTGYVTYTENDDDVTADFLFFANGRQIARYEAEFTTALESDVDDSAGSSSTTGTFLTDFEDVQLTMLGKKFEVVTARRVSSAGNSIILTLMGGAAKDTLLEGQTKTYTIDGKDFEVTLNYVDSDEAQFTINGQTTRKLVDGDTDKLSDGTTVGVSEILYQDYAGGIHSATFFIGAQKIELRDNLITDTASDHELEVDDETIDNADVIITGTDDNTTFRVDSIILNISADDDFYVPVGGKLSDAIKAADTKSGEPEAIFTNNWDVEYLGLSNQPLTEINVKSSGSDEYQLTFQDGKGNMAKLPIAHSPSASTLVFGDDDDNLIIRENQIIMKDDYFIVTDMTDTDGERQSFALRYRKADRSTKDNPILRFEDLGSGSSIEERVSVSSSSSVFAGVTTSVVGTIKLGGGTFNVYNASSHLSDDFNLFVDLDGGSTAGLSDVNSSSVVVNTKDGARISLINGSYFNSSVGWVGGHVVVNVTTPNTDDFDDLVPTAVSFNITADSNGEVRMNKAAGQNLNFISPEDDDDNEYAYTSQGAFVKYYSASSDPQELTVWYPKEQRVPLVYVTSQGTSFMEATASETDPVLVQRIQVGAAKLASEIADIKAQNTILVGGPCANAGAAAVMGASSADCAAGFEPGVGLVQLWEHTNGNVAMLVAGYSGLDTRNAAQVVANYKEYAGKLKGMKVEVKKVQNQLTVAAPAPKAVMSDNTGADAMSDDEGTA